MKKSTLRNPRFTYPILHHVLIIFKVCERTKPRTPNCKIFNIHIRQSVDYFTVALNNAIKYNNHRRVYEHTCIADTMVSHTCDTYCGWYCFTAFFYLFSLFICYVVHSLINLLFKLKVTFETAVYRIMSQLTSIMSYYCIFRINTIRLSLFFLP